MAVVYFFVGVFALFLGSFLNVVAIRVPRGESVVRPPSRCSRCGHRLSWKELIPVASYLWQKGKCRHCGQSFSSLYLLGELLTMLLFLLVFADVGLSRELFAAFLLTAVLVAAILSDLLYRLIPNRIVFAGMVLMLAARLFHHPEPWYEYALGVLVGGGTVFALNALSLLLFKKEGMGGGDLKLYAFIGLAVGWKLTLLSVFLASMAGAAAGMALILAGKLKKDHYMPFGPAIAFGTIVAYLWGTELLELLFPLKS